MNYQPLWLHDLVSYSIQAAALAGVGVLMARALRLHLPKVRLAYWQVLLVACVFLPVLQPWRPEILITPGFSMSNITLAATEAPPAPLGPPLAEIVLWLICAGIVLRLAWMALGLGRLWLYRRHAERINLPPESVREAQRLVPAFSSFFISRQIPTPATFGFFRPAILFPARFIEMEHEMQKAIALHELLHVERRDWLWNMFEELVLTLLWFHLPLWWVVRSARLSREQVVDAEAIRRSNARRPYLKALLEMAGQKGLAEGLPAPLFLRESQLAERVTMMMKEVHMSRTRLTVSILAAAVTLLIAGATMVWAFPLKTSVQQAEAPTASSAPGQSGNGTYQFQGKDYKFLGKIYKVGGKVSAPIPIYKPDPPYTPEAKKAHLSGPVVLWAVIDPKGEVVEVHEQSKPLGQGLDESALNKVRTWKFKPGMREGVPVPVKVMVEVYFRYYDGKKSDPATDPPAQSNQNDSADANKENSSKINQEEIQRQIDEAMKQAKVAQEAASKIDQKKLQEQMDQAMKQLKMAEVHTPKIDEAKINREIEQAMKQAQLAQDAVPKIDQDKLQEQIEQSMKQFEKMNTPELRQKMKEQMKQLEKMNTPEMRRQMQEQMEQLKKMNTPEMRQQLKQAMEQAMMAQESVSKMNKDEVQRQLEQARKEVEQAKKEAQAARKEAEKARQDAMKARREAEEQRKAAKPAPSAVPKPAPAPPKEITAPSPPPAPPAVPKTPESAGIIGGVPGGVVGGVPGGAVGGVPGGQVKGIEGGHVIGVPGGITGGVITAPHPPVPPASLSSEPVQPQAAPASPASPSPPPPQN